MSWFSDLFKRKAPTPAVPTRPVFTAQCMSVGTSMLPTYGATEMVALELCKFGDLRARDTVIFWHDVTMQYVHHRLVERHEVDGRWLTRGDNNGGRDTGRMTEDEFVGRTKKLVQQTTVPIFA